MAVLIVSMGRRVAFNERLVWFVRILLTHHVHDRSRLRTRTTRGAEALEHRVPENGVEERESDDRDRLDESTWLKYYCNLRLWILLRAYSMRIMY